MTLVLTGNTEVPTTRTELFVVQPGKILLFQIHLNITANEAPGMGGGAHGSYSCVTVVLTTRGMVTC